MFDKVGFLYIGDIAENSINKGFKGIDTFEMSYYLAYRFQKDQAKGFMITKIISHKLREDLVFVGTTHGMHVLRIG